MILCLLGLTGVDILRAQDDSKKAGSVVEVEGIARKRISGTEGWLNIEKGMTLGIGDSVQTLDDGRLTVEFADNGTFRIGKSSTVFITDDMADKYDFPELVAGDIWAIFNRESSKNYKDSLPRILLPTAVVSTGGAEARFAAGEDCTVEIKSYDGQFRIRRRTQYYNASGPDSATVPISPCAPDSSLPDSSANWSITLEKGHRVILASDGHIVFQGAFGNDDPDEQTDWVRWNKEKDENQSK